MSKYTLYAVSTAKSQSNISATEQSNLCKAKGGAGYTYISDNYFYIIASIYENKADAEKVVQNIKESTSAEIVTIEISPFSLNSNLSNEEKSALENSITIFKTSYKELYDISISLDTAVMSEVNARLSLNQLNSKITTTLSNFNTMFNEQMTSELLTIKLKLNNLLSSTDKLVNPDPSIPLTSQIKYTYCDAIFLLKDLSQNIS